MLVIAMIDENAADVDAEDFDDREPSSGSPEQIADQIKTKVLDAGVDGGHLSPLTSLHGYHPGQITAVAEALEAADRRLTSRLRWVISPRSPEACRLTYSLY